MRRQRKHRGDANNVRRLEERVRLYAEQIPTLTLFSEQTRRRLRARLAKEIGVDRPDRCPVGD
jgi:hypothetical protein